MYSSWPAWMCEAVRTPGSVRSAPAHTPSWSNASRRSIPGVVTAGLRISWAWTTRTPAICPSVPSREVVVDERLCVELPTSQDEPDRLDGHVAERREPVRDRRVDRDRVTRLEDVLIEADADLQAAAQEVAPFVARVPLEGVGRARRAADLVGHAQELDAGFRQRREPLPQ